MTTTDIPNPKVRSWFTAARSRRAMKAYGADIGYLAISWNRLHDNLAKLFTFVINSPSPNMAGAVWYCTDSDAQQRKMLRAAIDHAQHLTDQQRKAIIGVLNQIEKPLRHNRNDALHAPLVLIYVLSKKAFKAVVKADEQSLSPRARSLRGKDLKKEFREYIELSRTLSGYTGKMVNSLRQPGLHAWPDKPPLPHAHRKKSRKGSSRRSTGKQPPRPPRSSQG